MTSTSRGRPRWQEPLPPPLLRVSLVPPQEMTAPPLGISAATNGNATRLLWNYAGILAGSLFVFVAYLILPKGLRKVYCRSGRRRYTKSRFYWGKSQPPSQVLQTVHYNDDDDDNSWMQSTISADESFFMESKILSPPKTQRQTQQQRPRSFPPTSQQNRTRAPYSYNIPQQSLQRIHPGIETAPEKHILDEAMYRLRMRGLRLVAHGVHCEAKRVWLRLEEEDTLYISWQTEIPREITSQDGHVSTVLTRGNAHRIPAVNILYIDIGKKTTALMKTGGSVPAAACFSLLTQGGSLDLQTNSRLERDALVCCLSHVLDQVHLGQDWRRLYEEAPAPSEYMSSVGLSHISAIASDAFQDV